MDKEERLRDMEVPVSSEYHSAKALISGWYLLPSFVERYLCSCLASRLLEESLTGLFTFPNLNL